MKIEEFFKIFLNLQRIRKIDLTVNYNYKIQCFILYLNNKHVSQQHLSTFPL